MPEKVDSSTSGARARWSAWAWGSDGSASGRQRAERKREAAQEAQHRRRGSGSGVWVRSRRQQKVSQSRYLSLLFNPLPYVFQTEQNLLYLHPVPRADDGEQYARQKFGTQKSISSDEFFGKGAYDPASQAEAKTRLQGFEGATSISSNAYFGRPEDEEGGGPGGAGAGGLAGIDLSSYGDIETAARDVVRRLGVTTADDLENLSHVLGEGAQKLQGAIRSYLNS